MSKQKVAIVTDSTAYIPKDAMGDFDIPIIPLWLHWGQDSFRDGVDIDPSAFYRRLQESKDFPTTSQPSAGEFEELYQRVGAGVDGIVGIFISSKISGTVANAQASMAQFPDTPIRVIDSLTTSMSLGFVVLEAARAAAAGKSLDEVVAVAESARDRVRILFTVGSLEYLYRGGRIGGANRLMGTMLSIKPLLHLYNGGIEPLGKVRTKRKAVARMWEIAEEQLGGKRMAEACGLYIGDRDEGDAIVEQIKARFDVPTVYCTTVSPVIGAHVGPGTVGLAFRIES